LIELQRLLLPSALSSIGCTEAATAYRSANDRLRAGGDWFDLVDRPDNNTVIEAMLVRPVHRRTYRRRTLPANVSLGLNEDWAAA